MSFDPEIKIFKVMIIDDHYTFRKTLRGLLDAKFPFFSYEEAASGKDALQKVKGFLPDLIFMDIKLPGASGLELTKKIKESYPEIIIIILTNYDLPEYREAAKKSGSDYFLSKGISNTKEILELVKSIIPRIGSKQSEKGPRDNPK